MWVHNECYLDSLFQAALKEKKSDAWLAFAEAMEKAPKARINERTRLVLFNKIRHEWLAGSLRGSTPTWEKIGGQILGKPAASGSKWLGKNMGITGIEAEWYLDDGSRVAAHHIVEAGDTSDNCVEARRILDSFHVDIHEAANGVFLPKNELCKDAEIGLTHTQIHTTEYSAEVLARLQNANAQTVRRVLQEIADELVQGTFPYK